MTSEIKQRIEQINSGQVPEGYKKTEFGIFPCDWVTDKTFGDLFSFNGGLGKSREELSENGIEYLHYGDMHRSDFSIASLEQYSKLPKYDTKIKGDESFLMQDGDVAFLDASEDLEGASRSVLIDNPENKPFIAGLHIIYGKPRGKELSKYYKQYLTRPEYIKKQFKKLASGFKVYGLNRNTITGIKCAYPKSTAEQEKIAEILMKWNDAIELYNQQIEKLNLLKSSCIKKMFPQKGKKVPEWRFKGFSNAWEQRKVTELGKIFIGLVTTMTEHYTDEGALLIRNSDIKDGRFEFGDNPIYLEKSFAQANSSRMHQLGDVVTVHTGDVGTSAVIRENQVNSIGFATIVTRPNTKIITSDYLCTYLNTDQHKKWAVGVSTGDGRTNYNLGDYYECVVPVPTIEEQQKISEFISNLNNLITLHQRKVEIIIRQRKALQQYLLNGIVRVEV